jgi:uncharacterized repeat protein (TIGR03803 family)
MKTHKKTLSLVPMLITGVVLMVVSQVTAQNFTVLHSFTGGNDGASPLFGTLVLSSNTLYGTANLGGAWSNGTVFKVNVDGTGFTNLHTFAASDLNGVSPVNSTRTNSDGAFPNGLILSSNTLYGTASHAGSFGLGTVFAVKSDGTGFTNLHSFTLPNLQSGTNSDGTLPAASLILSNNTLYGTAQHGGGSGNGTVFKLNVDGTGFTTLHSFTALDTATSTTNNDGANPQAPLILSGNTLYGTSALGGSSGSGTVFALNRDGTGFAILHSFTTISGPLGSGKGTNNDGAVPIAALVLSGNTLYGTANQGGSSGAGTVFKVNADGTGFTTLHSFTTISGPSSSNSDGAYPFTALVLSGNTLYGTAPNGGSSGAGTVFKVNADGTGFTALHSFAPTSGSAGLHPYGTNSDGAYPEAALVLSGNTLYGTALDGGISGDGTVFSLSFPAQLSIIPSGADVILTWPTNYLGFDYTGFTLQSTTNLVSPAVWATNSTAPVVENGQYAVTNPITGTAHFFRLRSH